MPDPAEPAPRTCESWEDYVCPVCAHTSTPCKQHDPPSPEVTEQPPEFHCDPDLNPAEQDYPASEVAEQPPERVEQGDAEGCGAAVLAMLVGISYEEAKADLDRYRKDDHDWATQGTWYGAIDQALARRGYYVQRRFQSDYEGPFAPLHYASVKQPSGGGHFVVMTTEGKVLDPLREGDLTLADYEINNVVGIHRPVVKPPSIPASPSEVAVEAQDTDYRCGKCGAPLFDGDPAPVARWLRALADKLVGVDQ